MVPAYEQQFRGWTAPLSPEDWRGKLFLDAGCGMGRNSYWPMTYGAAGGLAIDVDTRSIAAARETLARYPGVTVEQRSVYDLQRKDEFDIAFSIGVIHHLEFPELALERMVGATKPGGSVLIWVYGLENNRWIVYGLSPLRRLLFSRLPISWVHALALVPAIPLWCFVQLGLGRIAYFKSLQSVSFRHLRLIVFDQMLPRIAHYWPRETVEAMMRKAGLKDVRLVWVNEMSWSAIGRKRQGK
jgi:SAM-dependent methyltransferase